MPEFYDQLNRKIIVDTFPERIISLVPSITELLFDLDLNDEVIGITKFCVHPEKWFSTKPRIGGTKNINIDAVNSLKPQLIIANKEENVKEQIEQLQSISPVYISDVTNLESALTMITDIGKITSRFKEAEHILQKIKKEFAALKCLKEKLRVCYLIWQKPCMSIGADTFINDMLLRCGFENIFGDELRYPETSIKEMEALKPDLIFLSSEPFPFKQKHISIMQQQLPGCKFFLADGEMFSWYGSRLQIAAVYFQSLINKIALEMKLH